MAGTEDIFNGNRLDLTKWDPFPYGGATISTGSGLRYSLNGIQGFSGVQVFTLYQFSGDFDVQVDFTLGASWNTPFPVSDTSPQLHGGEIAVYLDEPNWMVISRSRFSDSEGFNFYSNVDLETVPRSKFTPSTATGGSLRIVATNGTYHFLFNQGSGWVELATAPAWNQPVRLFLNARNTNSHVSFSSTLNNFRVNSGSTDDQPYQLPGTFLHRPGFMIGGQFIQATLDRYFSNQISYNPMSELFAQGMRLARGCMTTVSDPDLAANPPAQWHTLGWENAYWSSLQVVTQLFKDAMAAGMRINACFFLSEDAAGANGQDAPPAWRNLSVEDTAARVEQYMYETTTYLINQGIRVDLYDIGNEILFGILNFRPGDRLPSPTDTDMTRSISYLKTSIWPTEATLLIAAIRGIRRADPQARTVLHIESLLSPGMDTAFAFFQTMQSLGVPYDVAALSLPYMDYANLSGMMSREYFQRFNSLVNRIAALGIPVYIAENSYPADTDPSFNPPISDFPYTEAGQSAYVNSQLRWASNNQHIIGWSWYYPEWFPGINATAPANLMVQGLYRDRQTLRPAAAELNVPLPYLETVQKIYIGYYQRPADPAGLIYWAGTLDAKGGDLTEIIDAFANSDESRALYGTINSGNISTVVNGIYNALFARDAETAGIEYWVSEFNSGRITAASIMLNLLNGAQNEDLQSVNNKLTAANLFTKVIDPELDGANFQATYAGGGDATAGRNFLTLHATSMKIPTQAETTGYIKTNIANSGDGILAQ